MAYGIRDAELPRQCKATGQETHFVQIDQAR